GAAPLPDVDRVSPAAGHLRAYPQQIESAASLGGPPIEVDHLLERAVVTLEPAQLEAWQASDLISQIRSSRARSQTTTILSDVYFDEQVKRNFFFFGSFRK